MFRGNHLQVAGKTAIIATLLGGSSMALAQNVAPVVVQPTVAPPVQQAAPAQQPAPAATPQPTPAVTPPPVVRTVPDAEPVAQAEADRPAPRRQAAAAPTRTASRVEAAPATVAAEPVAINEPSAVTEPLPSEETGELATTIEGGAAIAPVAETDGVTSEGWTLGGGIAAVLAALGLGALAMRRRRRAVNDNDARMVAAAPAAAGSHPASRPGSQDPAFQRPTPITTPEPFIARPASTPMAEPAIQRRPLTTRPEVPVTDPLFSHKVTAPPITDPMFAPKTAVEPPITDPMFAKHPGYAGRFGQTGATPAREPELIN